MGSFHFRTSCHSRVLVQHDHGDSTNLVRGQQGRDNTLDPFNGQFDSLGELVPSLSGQIMAGPPRNGMLAEHSCTLVEQPSTQQGYVHTSRDPTGTHS